MGFTREMIGMMTVNEVSRLTGISVRTLQYYDKIGLLAPTARTDAGYRLYDEKSLDTLRQILLYRELEFSLSDIAKILISPSYDRREALHEQEKLLEMKKRHIEDLIALTREIAQSGGNNMDFSAFDTSKMDEYAREAKEKWGKTDAYGEYERKNAGRSKRQEQDLGAGLMTVLAAFGTMRHKGADAPEVQGQVSRLQAHITEHFYTCTNPILASLGEMYASGGEFTENIDAAGGKGTAEFIAEAIRVYCK